VANTSAKTGMAMRDIVRYASLLASKRKELETLRQEDVRDWSLNREFYNDNQWVFWNRMSNRVESLGVDDGDKPRYKVRLTANQVKPGVQGLVAQMTKTRPVIRARAASAGLRDVKAAQFAEALYEHLWRELGLGSKLTSALVHAQLSAGYWMITWDALAGKRMTFMLNPESGEPVLDDLIADAYREELREMGGQELVEMFEKTVLMGEINVQAVSGEQVWLDPIATNFEDAKFAVVKVLMDVDDISARWKKKVPPDSSIGDDRPTLMFTQGKAEQRPKTARAVYYLFHKPTPSLPKGRIVVWIESPNEILAQSDWNLPITELPLVKFPGIERPGSLLDAPRVSMARPLQKELNNTISRVAMFKNMVMRPQMLAPVGSLRQRLTDEPGAVIEYAPIQGAVPEWRPVPGLPTWVFEYLQDIQRRLDKVFNLMPAERSQLPARTDSGQLVELVQEAVADQIAPEIHRMEDALAKAGQIIAEYAQTFYTEPRSLRIIGPGGSVQVKKFHNADLQGKFSFVAEAGSGLPRTRAGRMAQLREMIEMGVAQPHELMPYMPVAGLETIQQRLQADEDYGFRKIEKLLKGEPLNVPAMLDAIQQVETGMNPMTGEEFQDPMEAQNFVELASLSPAAWENLPTTAFILGQHMKTPEFEAYAPEIQQRFVSHFEMITEQLRSQPTSPEPIKASLSLKGTVGPTVAAEILKQKGLQTATPETMAEPPLETSVYDSVDKPDADAAGNDPLTQMELLHSMEQAEDEHQLKVARGVADLQLAEKRAAQADDDSDGRRKDEMHEQKMRHAEEAHRERIRQSRQRPKEASSGGS
jgi:hypothetical protein